MLARMRDRIVEKYWRARLSGTARAVRDARLTYLPAAKLRRLETCLARIEKDSVDGDWVEFGVALGGSSILIAARMGPRRRFAGYDLFGTIPPPSEQDGEEAHRRYRIIADGRAQGIGGDRYYGYESNLYERVKANFAAFGLTVDDRRIRLVKGMFEDTVSFNEGAQIAFAHIDSDWHDPVALCLERSYPHLARGAIVVLDDYNDYQGCRQATHEFLERYDDIRLLDASYNAILARV